MKIAHNRLKKSISILEKYGLTFDAQTGKYYFAKIKKNKEGYILFLFMILNWFDNRKDIDNYIVNNYAYLNCDTGKLEDISLIDILIVRAKYFQS